MTKTFKGNLALLAVSTALIAGEAKADRTIIIHDRTETTTEEEWRATRTVSPQKTETQQKTVYQQPVYQTQPAVTVVEKPVYQTQPVVTVVEKPAQTIVVREPAPVYVETIREPNYYRFLTPHIHVGWGCYPRPVHIHGGWPMYHYRHHYRGHRCR